MGQRGDRMTDIRKPRGGSLAFRPRKRAEKLVPTINYWPEVNENAVLGFAGYKAGMLTVGYINNEEGPAKGMEVFTGATVIETPPMKVFGIRAYENGSVFDEYTENKEFLKPLSIKKDRIKSSIPEKEFKDIRLLIYAQPKLTVIGMKHIQRMEIAVGGDNKLEFARSLLGKELRVKDVLKEGMFIDVVSITKGKGWQGPIKRFGLSKQRRKATGKVRHVGTLGPFHPPYVMYTVPQAGQMGFHKRTELNKWVLKIGENPDEINPPSGFPHYGIVKNDYIIVKGSIPGSKKRLVRFRWALRRRDIVEPKLTYISKDSIN